jgi:hypothetical protein
MSADSDSDVQMYDRALIKALTADNERLRTLLNHVRVWMKNIDRRESEEPLYRAICAALEPKP